MSRTRTDPGAVGVVGGGVMGVGIAQVLARAGHAVRVYEPHADARGAVLDRLAANCATAGDDVASVTARTSVTGALSDACADVVAIIEAVPENDQIKRQILTEIEAAAPPEALIGTNTSSIPLRQLEWVLQRPHRFVGTHFWHPPYLVPLVEVVRGARSGQEAVSTMVQMLTSARLVPVLVQRDVPGIIGNRLQHALKREAIALVAGGVATAQAVDLVVRNGFGRRLALVGPLEQADLGGLDLTMAIHEVLMPDLDVTPKPHPLLAELVARGDLGAKTGRGFYTWPPGEAERRRAEIARGLMADDQSHDMRAER